MGESILEVARRADLFVTGKSPIHALMRRLAKTFSEDEGIPYISLSALLELKTADGMTAVHRPRDRDDVIQRIRVNHLALEYAEQLNPYVQNKFRELWQAAQVEEEY